MRVADDYEQMVSEGGEYYEECGSRVVAIDSADDLRAWFDEMQNWCRAVRLVDGLIHKLSDADWTRSAKGNP